MKIVISGEECRLALMRGVDRIADAVKSTLGPRGRNVIIGQRQFGKTPRITKDGVTVANWVDCDDAAEQLGSDLLREASQRTMDTAGDGTTTAMVLAQAMCRMGFDAVRKGAAPFAVKRGMERTCELFTQAIRSKSVPASGDGRTAYKIAFIAGNGDSEIASLVQEAVDRIGVNGVITVEEARDGQSTVEIVPGLQIPAGYLSQDFVTNFETMKCEYQDPAILLWEGHITSAAKLGHVLAQTAKELIPLVVIAGDYEQEALALLIHNRRKMGLQSVAIKLPVYGPRRCDMLRDLAALTGGMAFTEDLGVKLETVELKDLGRAQKVVVDSQRTIISGGKQQPLKVSGRVRQVNAAMESAKADDKPYLQARLAGLTGGVAVIKVGAVTETQMKERKDRVEDAMYAARAALDGGVVPGGGTTLLRVSGSFFQESRSFSGDERIGGDIVRLACQVPCYQIARNAGIDGKLIASQVLAFDSTGEYFNWGYNAATETIEDLLESGVIDPAKVVIETLRNAVAVAGELICTDAAVMDVEDKNGADAPVR